MNAQKYIDSVIADVEKRDGHEKRIHPSGKRSIFYS